MITFFFLIFVDIKNKIPYTCIVSLDGNTDTKIGLKS